MNHSQACAPVQMASALQAIYQFLNDNGFVSTAEMLAEESSVPYAPESLTQPSTLITALTHYSSSRDQAFKVKQPDPAFTEILQWIATVKASSELYATYQLRQLQTHMANVIACKWQPKQNSSIYAAGAFDKTVAICSADSNTVLRRVNVSGPVLSMHFNPVHTNLLLTTCLNGGHTIVDVEMKEEEQAAIQTVVAHKKWVVTGKWSPSGTHYATGSHDGTLHVYGASGANRWTEIGRLEYTNNVESIEWIDATHFYASVREDNYIHDISLVSGADGVVTSISETTKYNTNEFGDDHVSFNVLDMSLCPVNGGKTILLATDSHRVILMQTGTSGQVRNFYNLLNDGYSTPRLAWSAKGKYAFVTCQDRTIAVLDIASGQTIHKLKGHEVNVRDVSVNPFTNHVLSCSYDRSCRVWTQEVQ